MNVRFPLFTKVLFLAFLNLCLLALAMALIARVQFQMDARSFLLAPAKDRIMSVAHALALEMEDSPPDAWDPLLSKYSQTHGVSFSLLDEQGERVAGPELQLPREVVEQIPRRQRPRQGPPPPERAPERDRKKGPPAKADDGRPPAPPLFLLVTAGPTRYWAGVRIPVQRHPEENPKPGTLILMSPSAFGNKLFFDVKPWLTVVLAVVLVSVAVWLPFIRGLTRSISRMMRTAMQIAEGRFDVQASVERRDEIGQLGETINRMAARLSGYVNGQKRFLSGIAHELCTPIATIQFGLGNLERRLDEQHKPTLADIQEEVQHMSNLVNELLSFSRAGIEAAHVKLVPVNVAATIARALEREASSQTNIESAVDDSLNVLADTEYLFRAISNIVRNAIRYAGHAGPIRITASAAEGIVSITVADSGPGVPEHALDEIFTPFYRLDPSRHQETGGVGLGLAIVRTCVEACHGSVVCRNRRPSGLEVEIRLPQAEFVREE